MSDIKYSALGSATSVLTTELNSLASGSVCSASAAQSNDAAGERLTHAVIEVYVAAQGANRAAGANLALYCVPTIDATNFGDTTGTCLDNYLADVVDIDDAALAARRLVVWDVPVPPTDHKWLVKNNTGQALAASGNTVKVAFYNRSVV